MVRAQLAMAPLAEAAYRLQQKYWSLTLRHPGIPVPWPLKTILSPSLASTDELDTHVPLIAPPFNEKRAAKGVQRYRRVPARERRPSVVRQSRNSRTSARVPRARTVPQPTTTSTGHEALLTTGQLAAALAGHRREGRITNSELAAMYRTVFERLGMLRHDSQPQTAVRRLQRFLHCEVYDRLILHDQIPFQIAKGRETGHQRKQGPKRSR